MASSDDEQQAQQSSQETLVGAGIEGRLAWWESEVEKVAFVCQAWLTLTDGDKYLAPIHNEILTLAFEVAICLSEHDALTTGSMPPESTLTMCQVAKTSEEIVRRYDEMKRTHSHVLDAGDKGEVKVPDEEQEEEEEEEEEEEAKSGMSSTLSEEPLESQLA